MYRIQRVLDNLELWRLSNPFSSYDSNYIYRPWLRVLGVLIALFLFISVIISFFSSDNMLSNSLDNNDFIVALPSETTSEQIQATPLTSPSITVSDVNELRQPDPNPVFHKVTRVVDGDTVEVNIAGLLYKIRVIGIDTPETVDPRSPVQCYGIEASNQAKNLLSNKYVSLETDSSQSNVDSYGRLLRYIYLEDGTSFNYRMILEGYANEYTFSNPYKYQSEFKRAEQIARSSQSGLWSPSNCNGSS